MPVRSVRLPDALWRRLEATLVEVNRDRRRKLGMSSVIRTLIEKALDDPGDAFAFDAKVARPDRVHRDRAAKLARARANHDSPELFERVGTAVDRLEMTPPEFAAAIGGDRHEAERFYFNGSLPEGDAAPFLERIRAWVAAQGA